MKFYKDGIFHIYNQGNNKQQIFFDDENYDYFQWKMKSYLVPFGDLISWCLMPNHFHWQFIVRKTSIPRGILRLHRDQTESERRIYKYGHKAIEIKRPNNYYRVDKKEVTLNMAIGILLCSYTKSINSYFGCSGSLFRKHCKSKDGFNHSFDYSESASSYFDSPYNESFIHGCFRYIHENPVRAGIVRNPHEYFWSSAKEYKANAKDGLCNVDLGRELLSYKSTLGINLSQKYSDDALHL